MAKYDAYGTTFYIGTSGAGTAVAQVVSISGPSLTLDTEDVTSMDSTDAWEEVVPTIKRSGEVSLELVYDPAAATHKNASGGLLYAFDQRASGTYTLVFPDAASTEWVFTAYVTGYEPDMPVDGRLAATVTFKPTGDVTLA